MIWLLWWYAQVTTNRLRLTDYIDYSIIAFLLLACNNLSFFFVCFNYSCHSVSVRMSYWNTKKPSYRWQTRATRKHAKNCSNSTCVQRCRGRYWPIFIRLAVSCCVRNLRNPAKFTKNSNLWSSRSSKVIDLGVNGKPICDFILVINSNFNRICYRFRDIHG